MRRPVWNGMALELVGRAWNSACTFIALGLVAGELGLALSAGTLPT